MGPKDRILQTSVHFKENVLKFYSQVSELIPPP